MLELQKKMFMQAQKIAKHFKIKAYIKDSDFLLEFDESVYIIILDGKHWIVKSYGCQKKYKTFWFAFQSTINVIREHEVAKWLYGDLQKL